MRFLNDKKFRYLLESFAKKVEEIEEQVIREISDKDMEPIRNFLSKLDVQKLPFNNIFGDKYRLVIPIMGKNEDRIMFYTIKYFLERMKFVVDFKKGVVKREINTQKGKKIRVERIGKILSKIEELYLTYDDARTDYESAESGTKQEEMLKEKVLEYTNLLQDLTSNLPSYSDRATEYRRFWNEKAEYYLKNPEELEKEQSVYSIILSRHPIDILRMSDFENIRSCHSPRFSYWKCAIAEAHGHGLVGFVVENKNLKFFEKEKRDLQDNEIFFDNIRQLPGLKPVSRIRAKKFDHVENGLSLAVPEITIYGKKIPGIYETLAEFLKEKQQKEIESFLEDEGKNKKAFDLNNFFRRGGSYEDTISDDLFKAFLKNPDYEVQILGSAGYKKEDQKLELDKEVGEIAREVNQNLQHVRLVAYMGIRGGLPEYGNDYDFVYFRGRMEFGVPEFFANFENLARKEYEEKKEWVENVFLDVMSDFRSETWGDQAFFKPGKGKIYYELSTQKFENNLEGLQFYARTLRKLNTHCDVIQFDFEKRLAKEFKAQKEKLSENKKLKLKYLIAKKLFERIKN